MLFWQRLIFTGILFSFFGILITILSFFLEASGVLDLNNRVRNIPKLAIGVGMGIFFVGAFFGIWS